MTKKKPTATKKKRGPKPGHRNPKVYPTEGNKVCTMCKETLPVEMFYKRSDKHGKGSSQTYTGTCAPCNKRITMRWRWKTILRKHGEGQLVEHIAHMRKMLAENEEILSRFRSGQDIVYWEIDN